MSPTRKAQVYFAQQSKILSRDRVILRETASKISVMIRGGPQQTNYNVRDPDSKDRATLFSYERSELEIQEVPGVVADEVRT